MTTQNWERIVLGREALYSNDLTMDEYKVTHNTNTPLQDHVTTLCAHAMDFLLTSIIYLKQVDMLNTKSKLFGPRLPCITRPVFYRYILLHYIIERMFGKESGSRDRLIVTIRYIYAESSL